MFLLQKWWRDIFVYPQESLANTRYWDERGRIEGGVLSSWQRERADIALRYMVREPGLTISDIGSGSGEVLEYLSGKLPSMSGIALDGDATALAKAKEHGFETRMLELSSAVVLPECDYALLFEIIEHVPDSERLVAAARKSARKGIFVSVPNTGFFTYRLRLLFGKFPAQWAVHPGEHVRFWTLRDVRWWLRAQGSTGVVHTYEGVPILTHLVPSWFAAGIVVWIPTSHV